MTQRRLIGIGLTGTGLLLAVLASIWLAVQPGTLLSNPSSGAPVIIVFVLVFALMIAGAYLIVVSSAVSTLATAEMDTPLRVLDFLRGQGEQTLAQVSEALGVPVTDIEQALDELMQLQLFSGYYQRERQLVHSVDPVTMQSMTRCAVCGYQTGRVSAHLICPQCYTAYFSPQGLGDTRS